jgi:hypothetical protein
MEAKSKQLQSKLRGGGMRRKGKRKTNVETKRG